MDSSSYKDVTTSRGIKYHYFASPSSVPDKPTLLFLHGFPSTSYDWRHQVLFFQKQDYGLIVPDMLGYGGTDKPMDYTLYKGSAMAADIIDILNAEKVDKVFVIGHDWGCNTVSRLASYYPERFLGFGFLAASYMPPLPDFDLDAQKEHLTKVVGYELYGYTLFFCEDGADKIIESHWDSFVSMLYPHDPKLWKTDMAPMGKIKEWLLADKKGPFPSYISPPEQRKANELLKSGGIAAPLNWYKVMLSGRNSEDDKGVPKENYAVKQPVFFGGALQDYICLSWLGKATIGDLCKNVTVKEFDTDHWVQLAAPDELDKELLAWIKGIEM